MSIDSFFHRDCSDTQCIVAQPQAIGYTQILNRQVTPETIPCEWEFEIYVPKSTSVIHLGIQSRSKDTWLYLMRIETTDVGTIEITPLASHDATNDLETFGIVAIGNYVNKLLNFEIRLKKGPAMNYIEFECETLKWKADTHFRCNQPCSAFVHFQVINKDIVCMIK